MRCKLIKRSSVRGKIWYQFASVLSYGKIGGLRTSVNYLQEDAKKLYENLAAILRHFAMSSKSTELLNNALDALKMKNVNVLYWGLTKMAGFLDACIQPSSIIVPFLDAIVTGNIREEEMMFRATPKGVFLFQYFADLHPVFTEKYLPYANKDDVLVCEVYRVAHKTATLLSDPNLKTPLADAFLEILHVDPYNKIKADFDVKGSKHTVTLNIKAATIVNN